MADVRESIFITPPSSSALILVPILLILVGQTGSRAPRPDDVSGMALAARGKVPVEMRSCLHKNKDKHEQKDKHKDNDNDRDKDKDRDINDMALAERGKVPEVMRRREHKDKHKHKKTQTQ